MYEDFVELCQRGDAVAAGKFLRELSDLDRQQAIAFNDCASLYWSVANGREEVVRLLFKESSAKVLGEFFNDAQTIRALIEAAEYNHFETVRLFIDHCPKHLISNFLNEVYKAIPVSKVNLIRWAGESKNFNFVRRILVSYTNDFFWYLISKSPQNNISNLIYGAAKSNDIDFIKITIEQYENKHLLNEMYRKYAFRALIGAAQNGHIEVVSLLLEKCPKELLELMLTVSTRETHMNALMFAAQNGHTEVVRLLLEKCPTEVTLKDMLIAGDKELETALVLAAANGHIEVVSLLLEKCSDELIKTMLNARDNKGNTALIIAAQNGHTEVVRLLMEKCATEDILKDMIFNINREEETPLILAAQNGHTEVVRLLLTIYSNDQTYEKEEDFLDYTKLYYADSKGCSALNIAAQNGHIEIVSLLFENRSEKLIIEMLTCSYDGYTALIEAAGNGHVDVVRLLIEKCPTGDVLKDMLIASNEDDVTALVLAAAYGHTEVVKLLIEKCPKNLLDQIVNDNILKCITYAKNSRHFFTVEFLLGFIEENYTANGSNQMLEKAVETLNGTAYGDMNFVMSIIAQRKELKRQNPFCNVDEFNEHIFNLSQNPDLGKLLLTCKSLTAGIGVSNIGCFDIYSIVIDNIAGFKTNKTTIDRQLESIQSVMLKNDFDLSPRTREFSYEVCKNYLFNC